MKTATVICICGKQTKLNMVGNNNADGKMKCKCGRNITLHLRRYKDEIKNNKSERWEAWPEWMGK